jgi:NTP pyrophosphatase (non-canonical NTP hydrolase)
LTNEEVTLDFVGDVWDLAKLILGYNGARDITETEQDLARQLANCLWSVIVLAQMHNIDLEQAFFQTMDDLEQRLSLQL